MGYGLVLYPKRHEVQSSEPMAPIATFVESLQEQILGTSPLTQNLRLAGQILRDLSDGWNQLDAPLRTEVEAILSQATPLTEETLALLLEALSAYQKAIARASARASLFRYPVERDALFTYERVALRSSDHDTDRLERALLAGSLALPETPAGERAQRLLNAFLRLQPFHDYNTSVALLLTLAFLAVNGAEPTLDPEHLRAILSDSALLAHQYPNSTPNPSPQTYADSVDTLLPLVRATLAQIEQEQRTAGLVPIENLPEPIRATLQPAPGPSSEWRYLTLQDLIWINTEVVGTPQPYAYDRLEEATYYQYSYRQSRDVPLQAARFLWGYLKYRPFAQGNGRTAFIATLAFLEINGYEVHLPVDEASEWFLKVARRQRHPLDAIRQIAHRALPGKQPIPLRELVHHLIEHYAPALEQIEPIPVAPV